MTKCLYCGKPGPKRNRELSKREQHLACGDEHVRRLRESRCIACGELMIWGHPCDQQLPGTGYPERD